MRALLLIVLLTFTIITQAQQTPTISGTVTAAGKLMPKATVMLYKTGDSVLLKTTLSNDSGRFSFAISPEMHYDITVQFVGYDNYRQTNLGVDSTAGTIELTLKSGQLSNVDVIAKRPMIEVQADKTVFNVKNTLNATGLSAFDVLRKAPGVITDNQDNLIVEGKTGVKIFIDGRISVLAGEDLTAYLKGLQSTDIEAIEIITQPSSRYDAAGTAGIINIRLNKNKDYGTNGTVSAGFAQGLYAKTTNSISLNNRSRKLNLFTNYSNNLGKNYGYLNLDRFQNGFEYDQRSGNVSDNKSNNIRAGLDYIASKSSTFGILLNGNLSNYNSLNNSRTPMSTIIDDVKQAVLNAKNISNGRNSNVAANANYRYADKKGSELTVDADYGSFHSSRDSRQPNYYYNADETVITNTTEYRMRTAVQVRLKSLKADYTKTLGSIKLAGGLKSSSVTTDNVFDFYDVKGTNATFNTNRSNQFDYTEQINAAYVNYSQTLKKIGFQAGLRAEHTSSTGELVSKQQNDLAVVKRRYLDLFPSGGITWQASAKNSLALTYSRRIERPDYRSLNPFEYNTDELSFSKGNPFLKPQYTNTIKLSHTFAYKLTTALSYSYISNFFAQITDTLGNNKNFISPQNIANQKVYDISISYPFTITKWWSGYGSASAYRSQYLSTNAKFVAINQNTASLYLQNSFSLPKAIRLELSGWYSSPSIWAGTYRTRALGSLDMAVQKSVLASALSVRLAVSDIFHTSNWTGTTQYGNLYIKGSGGYESTQFRLSLTYKFGKKTVKAAANHKTGAEDEKERITN
jgi:iron complex outermembrane recepter protein